MQCVFFFHIQSAMHVSDVISNITFKMYDINDHEVHYMKLKFG